MSGLACIINVFKRDVVHFFFSHSWLILHAFQIPIRGNCDEEFVFHFFVDFKPVIGFQKFLYCCFWVIAFAPGAVGKKVFWHILDDCVKYDNVAAFCH